MYPQFNDPDWYAADSGADYSLTPGTLIVVPRRGHLVYSEGLQQPFHRHTPWVPDDVCPDGKWHKTDTPGAVLQLLDVPFEYQGKTYPYLWYCHLSVLTYHIRDGIDAGVHVEPGTVIGRSGIGRGVPHLHFGIISNREQADGEYMIPELVARVVAAGYLWAAA